MDDNTYNAIYQLETNHWWFVGRRRYVQNLIRRSFASNKPLILCEMGCGSGGNFEMLAQFGQVEAVEMDVNTCLRAKAKAKELKQVGRVENGWLPDNIKLEGPYDVVIALDVIEHIEDDIESLKAIKAYIKPGGRLIVTVPAYQWLWGPHDEANHHKRRYSKSLLKDRVQQAGFEVQYVSYFNSLLFPLLLLVRLVQKLSPSKKAIIDELQLPSPFINRMLIKIFACERFLAARLYIPFGLSIALIARVKMQA